MPESKQEPREVRWLDFHPSPCRVWLQHTAGLGLAVPGHVMLPLLTATSWQVFLPPERILNVLDSFAYPLQIEVPGWSICLPELEQGRAALLPLLWWEARPHPQQSQDKNRKDGGVLGSPN